MKGRGDEGGMLGGWIDKSKGTERLGGRGRCEENRRGVAQV